MASVGQLRATLFDLLRTEGKAELIGGRIVSMAPTGYLLGRVAKKILIHLDRHVTHIGKGEAFTDGHGFAVPELPSGRESFSPDAAYFSGPPPINPMGFIEGAPTFAPVGAFP